MKLPQVAEAMRVLDEVGLTTKEACGNTVRNVTGCAMAGVCAGEQLDVTPYALAVTRHFLRRPENQNLPRKFKIAFSGCSDDCAAGAINDVACIGLVEDGVPGFKVTPAGCRHARDAHELFSFVPAEQRLGVIEAVIAVSSNRHSPNVRARDQVRVRSSVDAFARSSRGVGAV